MLAGRNGLLQSAVVAGSFLVASVVVLAQHEDREKKFGDKCVSDEDCHFNGSTCARSVCHCRPEFEATNHLDKCGHNAAINKPCFFNEQCEAVVFQTECRDEICACRFERTPVFHKNGLVECIAKNSSSSEPYTDPAMLCVLAGMCLMFIIICVVLRLFSKARWRENRTIFNTPNPRLMNVSLLRDNKPPPGAAGERRGSKSSTKTHSPSRQPSMASLKPQSPSLGRVGVRGGNSETVRSPTAKSAAALPMDPKPASSSVAVDMTAA